MVAHFSGPRVLKYSARMITVGMPWILNIQTWHPLLAPSTTLRFTLTYSKQLHRTAKVLKTDRDLFVSYFCASMSASLFELLAPATPNLISEPMRLPALATWGCDNRFTSKLFTLSYHSPSKALGLWANQWTYPKLDNRGSSVICFTSPFFRRGNDGGFFFRTKVRHSRRGWEKQATSKQICEEWHKKSIT